jgi:hypothetical protein
MPCNLEKLRRSRELGSYTSAVTAGVSRRHGFLHDFK